MFADDARTAFQGCKAPWDAQLDELYKGAKPEEKKLSMLAPLSIP